MRHGVPRERISCAAWGKAVGLANAWPSTEEYARAEIRFRMDGLDIPATPAYYSGVAIPSALQGVEPRVLEDEDERVHGFGPAAGLVFFAPPSSDDESELD